MLKLNPPHKIFLALSSGLLFSLGFTQWHTGWALFFAFIPLLIIEEFNCRNKEKYKTGNLFLYSFIAFIIWNIISTYWIYYATAAGSFFALGLNALFMTVLFIIYHKIKLRMGRKEAYVALVTLWIAFEYIYLNIKLSWPWLNLGNSFANNVQWIQWYEFTGALGGTAWIIIINLLLFEIIRKIFLSTSNKKVIIHIISLLLIFLIPFVYSLIRYNNYSEKGNKTEIAILQPNIDPYKKFSISTKKQMIKMLDLAEKVVNENTEYLIFPETALPLYVDEDDITSDTHIKYLKKYVEKHPGLKIILGLTTRKFYYNKENKTKTAHKHEDIWFDEYNAVIQIDTTEIKQIYHKSKLVPGVETLPYIDNFKWLNEIIINLGGARNSLGYDDEPVVFKESGNQELQSGTVICYESVYGEYVSKFARNGAELIFIITNDGWWKDTPGYRQHAAFAKLRAIETRRSIARSANTGISAFINQRGDILKSRGWWIEDSFKDKLKANDKLTFYTKYGDYFGRISVFIIGLILLHWISYVLMKKKQ